MKLIKFFILGILFGIILIKAEVISWFRIQEMFHFKSFHMYGILGSAIATGMLSVFLIRKFNVKSITGEKIEIKPKEFKWKSNLIGGLIFGLGWAFTGACPGPIYALIGAGVSSFVIVFFAAVFGTFIYGIIRNKLPH